MSSRLLPLLGLLLAGCHILVPFRSTGAEAGTKDVGRPADRIADRPGDRLPAEGKRSDSRRDASKLDAPRDGRPDSSLSDRKVDSRPPDKKLPDKNPTNRSIADGKSLCDKLFDQTPGYVPCGETVNTCSFVAVLMSTLFCDDVCSKAGKACKTALDNVPNGTCTTQGGPDTCAENSEFDEICVCFK